MWTTAALLLAVTWPAAQPGTLTIGNERLTYGFFGPTRADAKFLPGDLIVLAFELNNINFDANNRATFSVALDVMDASGKSMYKQPARTVKALNYLGGKTLASFATLQIPPTFAAGKYKIKVTVEDKESKAAKTITRDVEVLPVAFGLVQVATTADHDAQVPAAPVGTIGTPLFVNFSVAGFTRGKGNQPNVSVSLRVLDESGKPATTKALTGKAMEDIPADAKLIPMQFGLTLNRLGRFTVELTATDEVTGKTARATIPLKVVTLD